MRIMNDVWHTHCSHSATYMHIYVTWLIYIYIYMWHIYVYICDIYNIYIIYVLVVCDTDVEYKAYALCPHAAHMSHVSHTRETWGMCEIHMYVTSYVCERHAAFIRDVISHKSIMSHRETWGMSLTRVRHEACVRLVRMWLHMCDMPNSFVTCVSHKSLMSNIWVMSLTRVRHEACVRLVWWYARHVCLSRVTYECHTLFPPNHQA